MVTSNERIIWAYLRAQGLTQAGTAGLMGNLRAECGQQFRPNNAQDSGNRRLGMTDEEYTQGVDNGTYPADDFVHDKIGFGVCQWTYWSRKQALLAYARQTSRSIADLQMQLEFLMKELSTSCIPVLTVLKTTSSVREASDAVLTGFEKPADQSETAKVRRAAYGQIYYDRYADKTEELPAEEETEPAYYINSKNYQGYSIIDALKSVGEKSSFVYRKKIAAANGITPYRGTQLQNSQMVSMFKRNLLKKP